MPVIGIHHTSCPVYGSFVCMLSFSLKRTRAKVWRARTKSQLFSTKQYAADMEELYHTVWSKYEAGCADQHITDLG